jgi:hypothetical protein
MSPELRRSEFLEDLPGKLRSKITSFLLSEVIEASEVGWRAV